MTFPRKVGLILLLVAAIAAWGHWKELSLPSLRWFFSFDATPQQIQDAATVKEWYGFSQRQRLEAQGNMVGYGFCVVMGVAGLVLLATGGKFQWNPLTVRKFTRFRSIGRGWLAFRMLLLLLLVAMLDQLLVGKRALAVKHGDQWIFPAFQQKIYYENDFGGTQDQEVNYRRLKERFAAEKNGDRVIMPPIPWDPTFDSDEVLKRPLVSNEGIIHRPGEKEPFNGQAVQFSEDNPDVQRLAARFRKGKRDGLTSIYDTKGEFAGRQTWKAGELVESKAPEDVLAATTTGWVELLYPPAPPSLKERHFLGTDSKGWDIAAQLYGGLQVIFKSSIFYLVLTYGIGITLGCVMGYFGGWFDLLMQRLIEVLSNVPFLLVVIIITVNLGRENVVLMNILLIYCIFSWITVATYLRTSTFREKARDYVAAARVQGAGTSRVIFRHILPNAISTIVTLLPFSVAGLTTSLTAMDFLGFGLPDSYPSWGRVLENGTQNLSSPWIVASVFTVMVSVLLVITFIGEAIREAFDPKKFTTYQ
ncbi:ABC transporter permease subunit [Luteolibacter flavescens]|uniref:ABC transporter permease subunit n=1 Tax=Luteolibacter flavescens TaxID=1859460 RepID=A0ABT3FIR0_9BACT|nr:ABC transporter permease subunit [Luteolibacter flavescens]MCW1883453.1 ABC transporter permease subunit [Luteolibacter flavescens]